MLPPCRIRSTRQFNVIARWLLKEVISLMTSTVCRLCLHARELCNSHIIPEFAFKSIYDVKHRAIEFSTDPSVETRYIQKGVRERLLCLECETKFSVFENYAYGFFTRGDGVTFSNNGGFVIGEGIDYLKFKLFQMSILWRAGVANHSHFRKVQLGIKHEERLRFMLETGDPGEEHEYGCAIFPVYADSIPGRSFEAVITPEGEKREGHTMYRFFFKSSFWLYCVSSHSQACKGRELFVTKAGTIKMVIQKAEAMQYFQAFARDIRTQAGGRGL